MADLITIGGYPVDVSGLYDGKILFFNGIKWVAVPLTQRRPETVAMGSPKINNEVPFSIDGIPVMIHDLAPGHVLTLCLFSSAVQVDMIGTDPKMFSLIENVPWEQLYCNMDDYNKPRASFELLPDPTKGLTTNAPAGAYRTEIT